MVTAEFLSKNLRFETEIKEEEIREFLELLLKAEPQRTVKTTSDRGEMWIIISMGTYGENYRGNISFRTLDKYEFRRIYKIAMEFHNKPHYGWED